MTKDWMEEALSDIHAALAAIDPNGDPTYAAGYRQGLLEAESAIAQSLARAADEQERRDTVGPAAVSPEAKARLGSDAGHSTERAAEPRAGVEEVREACAKVAEEHGRRVFTGLPDGPLVGIEWNASQIAAAIRALDLSSLSPPPAPRPLLYQDDGEGACLRCTQPFGAHLIRNTVEYPGGVACCPTLPESI